MKGEFAGTCPERDVLRGKGWVMRIWVSNEYDQNPSSGIVKELIK